MLAPDQLTFGVEVECVLPRDVTSYSDLVARLRTDGIQAQTTTYSGRASAGRWKIASDASLSGQIGGPRTGYVGTPVEVVSPVLRGEVGLEEARKCLNSLETFGCRVNRTCGLHVHVGARDLFGHQLGAFKELAKTYAKFEAVIDSVLAPSRRGPLGGNGYARAVPKLEGAYQTVHAFGRAYEAQVYGGRYSKLNLAAFWRHGTVEFRHHQGTVEADKVEAWVRLCLAMVSHATRNEELERTTQQRYRTEVSIEVLDASALRGYNPRRDRYGRIAVRARRMRNPRREGTRGFENWNMLVQTGTFTGPEGVPLTRVAHDSRFGMDHIRWDLEHGNIEAVRRNERQVPIPDEEAPTIEPFTLTDEAPETLDGLLELVGADDRTREYFKARQAHFAGASEEST